MTSPDGDRAARSQKRQSVQSNVSALSKGIPEKNKRQRPKVHRQVISQVETPMNIQLVLKAPGSLQRCPHLLIAHPTNRGNCVGRRKFRTNALIPAETVPFLHESLNVGLQCCAEVRLNGIFFPFCKINKILRNFTAILFLCRTPPPRAPSTSRGGSSLSPSPEIFTSDFGDVPWLPGIPLCPIVTALL